MNNYKTLKLAQVTSYGGKIEYFAVTEETLGNMEDTSAAMTYIVDYGDGEYQKSQFIVKNLGTIKVEVCDD